VEATIPDADQRYPGCAATVGGGLLFALGDGRGILAHREPGGRLHLYIALRAAENWVQASGIDFADSAGARQALAGLFAGWAPELRALITCSSGELVPRPIYALPAGHNWAAVPGVTLLGDAAHLMSPFAGEGANLAMQDGAELALAIARHPGDTMAALAEYEGALFPRSEAAAAESAANLEMSFRADAPQGMVELMAEYRSQAAN
jgi:2-polyprenyl-6-methoxyphenol hydroxylase-like FAD-dependent oxidoreductase